MGQKVSPVGLRVGVIRDWDSQWYANKTEVADLLLEDLKIRKYLEKNLEIRIDLIDIRSAIKLFGTRGIGQAIKIY